MERRKFIKNTALIGGLSMINPFSMSSANRDVFKDYPVVRVAKNQRKLWQ